MQARKKAGERRRTQPRLEWTRTSRHWSNWTKALALDMRIPIRTVPPLPTRSMNSMTAKIVQSMPPRYSWKALCRFVRVRQQRRCPETSAGCAIWIVLRNHFWDKCIFRLANTYKYPRCPGRRPYSYSCWSRFLVLHL